MPPRKRQISNHHNTTTHSMMIPPPRWILVLIPCLAMAGHCATAWVPPTVISSRPQTVNKLPVRLSATAPQPSEDGNVESSKQHQQQQQQNGNNNQQEASSPPHDNISSSSSPAASATPMPPRNVTREALKKVRVAKAQADIDRILTGPEAPFDMEAEFEKVASLRTISGNTDQPLLDAEISQLESELYQAVKQQDFTTASHKQEALGKLQNMEDGGAVLQVNSAFYRAFSQKNYDSMKQVWWPDPSSVCIHPSHKPLIGARSILKSWKRMFASTDGSFQRNWMEPHNIRVTVKGRHMAIVTCEEHVFVRRFVRGKRRQTELLNKLTATNIFTKVGDQWYMSYHHASWHADSEAAQRALRGESGGGRKGNKVGGATYDTSPLASSLEAQRRRRRRELQDEEQDDDEEEEDIVGMDGILGSDFGPLLGDGKNLGPDGKTIKQRVIMSGSLSDLLNGGLSDMLGGALNAGKDGSSGGDGIQESAIIQFGQFEEDDDDDEEDDEQDLDDDDDDDETPKGVTIIKKWAEVKPGNRGAKSQDSKWDASSRAIAGSDSQKKNSAAVPKDALRQNCITALRRLCDQGSISPKQKRVLLTDIVSCSAKGEYSMVEVAYELLCGEEGSANTSEDENDPSNDTDIAEEEFADQCRVFAQMHLDQ